MTGKIDPWKLAERTCVVCGGEFVGTVKALYCEPKCNAKAYRDRDREKVNARRRKKREERGAGERLMEAYEDVNHPGNRVRKRVKCLGCGKMGCVTFWGNWCFDCNVARMKRISAALNVELRRLEGKR